MRLMPDSAAPLLYMARVAERRGDPAGGRRFYEKAAERGSVVARGWLTREENQQQSRIRYRTLRPNPFRMAKRDAGIAILSFTDARGRSSDFGEQLYAALTRYKVSERFPIYDYGELAKLKSSDIRSLQPTDRTSMKALGERLRIEFVVSGRVHDPRRNHFTLRVTRTSDGSMIVEQEYRDVNEATAFADVARLFTEGVVPDRRER
jgi:hypothetical protein